LIAYTGNLTKVFVTKMWA